MDDIDKTGVYVIINKYDNKAYYGSASGSFKERWKDHRKTLKSNTHANQHLQNAYNLDGPSAFEYIILLLCEPDECLDYEQVFLDMYWDGGKECYNIRKDARSCRGIKRSPEYCEMLRQRALGKKASKATRKKMSLARKGRPSHRRGKTLTLEWRQKIGRSLLGRKCSPKSRALTIQRNLQRPGQAYLYADNTSGCTGVSFNTRRQKWIAYLGTTYLGRFDTIEEAIQVRMEAIQERYPNFLR